MSTYASQDKAKYKEYMKTQSACEKVSLIQPF